MRSPTQLKSWFESQNDLPMVNPSKMAQVSALAVPGHDGLVRASIIALQKHEWQHHKSC